MPKHPPLAVVCLIPLLVLLSSKANCQSLPDRTAIRELMDAQVVAWNAGEIDKFMEGYWKSDSLVFIGSKITRGWQEALERYHKSYPDKAAMGTLRFVIQRMNELSTDSYVVTGTYTLTRAKDNPHGIFTLLFQKKNGRWVIVYDHTS